MDQHYRYQSLTEEERHSLLKMKAALSEPGQGQMNRPSKLLDHLYLGSEDDARNVTLLKELGVTHVLNCATAYIYTGHGFYGKEFQYEGFQGEDDGEYDILQHFDNACAFIEHARKTGGKVLVHCIMGINRSGAIALAYLMQTLKLGPGQATFYVKRRRRLILSNEGFQYQLLEFARKRGLLKHDAEDTKPILGTPEEDEEEKKDKHVHHSHERT